MEHITPPTIADYNRFNDPHRAYSNYPSLLEFYKNNSDIPKPTGDVEDYVISAWNEAHEVAE